jgi:hypothetical protein
LKRLDEFARGDLQIPRLKKPRPGCEPENDRGFPSTKDGVVRRNHPKPILADLAKKEEVPKPAF